LSHFALFSPNIPFEAISEFLCRHHNIVDLDLFYDEITTAQPSRLPPTALPNLIHLTATPSYAGHFLQYDDAFPQLRTVSIICQSDIQSDNIQTVYDFTSLDDALAALSSRKTTIELDLALPCVSNIPDWLQTCQRNEISLPCVTGLAVRSKSWRPWSIAIMTLFPQWLTLFPALKRFRLDSADNKIIPKDKATFVRSIIDTCPRLKILSYGWDEQRSVANWMSMYS
jgi:hypothetical protein